jgi:hypothetical protein
MSELRLGDVIDDHCVKCRRLTNHSIVSIIDGAAAKVRCRTCYHDHDYRHEQAPPSKKDLKKAELFAQVLAGNEAAAAAGEPPTEEQPADFSEEPAGAEPLEQAVEDDLAEQPVVVGEEEATKKKARKTAKK